MIIPEIDRYRLSRMTAFAGHVDLGGYEGEVKPYERILEANRRLDEAGVPREGRVLFISHAMRVRLQLDPIFTTAAKIDPSPRIRGQVGEADMTPIVAVPERYLPEGVELLLTHPKATTAPQKLAEYKLHDNPPGINGTLCEAACTTTLSCFPRKRTPSAPCARALRRFPSPWRQAARARPPSAGPATGTRRAPPSARCASRGAPARPPPRRATISPPGAFWRRRTARPK